MGKMFDPKQNKPEWEGLPPGEYLIALRSFERKLSKEKRTPYLRAKYQVIAGPAKGKTFFASISLDMENAGSAGRLSLFAERCGVTQAFDLDNDDDFRRLFCDVVFKARVALKKANGYTNNDIERYLEMNDAEIKKATEWALTAADDEDASAATGSSGGGGGGNGKSGKNAFLDDDDIPF